MTHHRLLHATIITAAIIIITRTPAAAIQDDAIDYLYKTAPRAAGMGGAFTAIPGDPSGMFWNPAAAMRTDRLAISRTHSIRHFPHGEKNHDQLDSDEVSVTFPSKGSLSGGFAFTIPGEWGTDHIDTNGTYSTAERYRGRERRIAYMTDNSAETTTALFADSAWYRLESATQTITAPVRRQYDSGGGFCLYYEDSNSGMSYGLTLRGLGTIVKKTFGQKSDSSENVKITLGAAYRPDPTADSLYSADVEIKTGGGATPTLKWFAGFERSFDNRLYLRTGSLHGSPTYGLGIRAGSLRVDYAEVKNFMPKIVGPDTRKSFEDAHFYSYTINTKGLE